jgi:hypothetical protein
MSLKLHRHPDPAVVDTLAMGLWADVRGHLVSAPDAAGCVVPGGPSDGVRRAEQSPDRIIGIATVPVVAIDLSDRQVHSQPCWECGRTYQRVVIFAMKDGGAYSLVRAQCHGHADAEVWLDATFGSWEEPFSDHVTFSCRVSTQGAGLVNALGER